MRAWLRAACLLAACCAVLPALAEAGRRRVDEVTLYTGRGADLNFKEVPGSLLTADIPWEDSWFNGIGLSGHFSTLGEAMPGLLPDALSGVRQGYEVLLIQHHGRQTNQELGAAYVLKSPALGLGQRVQVAASFGIGMSWALGTPTYEDGPLEEPERRYRVQQLMLVGLEWRAHESARWAVETRIHHRSGVYGLVAPRHVGSNFFAVGLRYRF
jgi:hypothetical protein